MSIVPILKLKTIDGVVESVEVLGTGFVVGDSLRVITAKHVFDDSACDENEKFCYALSTDESSEVVEYQLFDVQNFMLDDQYDIASFPISSTIAIPLKLNEIIPSEVEDIISYEFSSTVINRKPDKTLHVQFQPYTHKGNIIYRTTSDFPETTPTPVFFTSFPALQGASGSPIMRLKDYAVVGMVVANYERHLLPAQVVEIIDGDNFLEERSHLLHTFSC